MNKIVKNDFWNQIIFFSEISISNASFCGESLNGNNVGLKFMLFNCPWPMLYVPICILLLLSD